MPPETKSLAVPESMLPRYEAIIALTDALCREKLNEEYAQLCREMAATLARKRPSPLVTGHVGTWACAIAYTVGAVNFLFDKSEKPYMRADELCAWFGVSKSTGGNKSTQLKRILNIGMMDPHWTLPSRMEDNFMTLAETARKLDVSFYAYMRDRITGAGAIPPLAELVTQAANKLCLEQPCPTPSY